MQGNEHKLVHIGYKHTDIYLNGTSTGPTANTETEFFVRGEANTDLGTSATKGQLNVVGLGSNTHSEFIDEGSDFGPYGSGDYKDYNGEERTAEFVSEFNLKRFLDQKGRDTDNNLTMTTIHIGNDATDKYFVFGSNNVATPAIDLTGLSGITVETSQGNAATSTTFSHLVRIVTHDNGYVVGKGGDGGSASQGAVGGHGEDGGDAISLGDNVILFVENHGIIGGGGGGGGAGGVTMYSDPTTGAKSSAFDDYSGSAGGGGAGFLKGDKGTTASAVTTPSADGTLFEGGHGATPNMATTHNSRVPGGKGGNLGEIGYGANMDPDVTGAGTQTKWAMSGDGGSPGAAIKGYDASRVYFIGPGGSGKGNLLGDESFKLDDN